MKEEEVTILITGDYCPINRIEEFSDKNQFELIFNDFLPFIQNADLSITNFEAPATQTNNPIAKFGPTLKVPPGALRVLKSAGFDLVTLANNHILDYGEEGLKSTIDSCTEYSIEYTGAGNSNIEASRIFFKMIKGKKIAIVNFAENEFGTTNDDSYGAAPLDPIQNHYNIQTAKQSADYVFVIIHGGHEMYSLPSPRMVETYRFFVAAGADAVIGHHTHCVSGYEIHNGKPIFYSLGNFVFDHALNRSELWCEGMAVLFRITKIGLSFNLIPFHQNNGNAGIHLMNDTEKNNFFVKLDSYNKIIANKTELKNRFDEYCGRVNRMYNSFLEPYSNRFLEALRYRYLFPSLLSKKKRKILLNLTRCESHRDIIIKILTK